MHITDPTAVGDVNEVYDMDVIDVPADFNPVSIIAGGKSPQGASLTVNECPLLAVSRHSLTVNMQAFP